MANPSHEYLVSKDMNMDKPKPYVEPSLEPEVTTLNARFFQQVYQLKKNSVTAANACWKEMPMFDCSTQSHYKIIHILMIFSIQSTVPYPNIQLSKISQKCIREYWSYTAAIMVDFTQRLYTYQKLQKDSTVPATLHHALFHMLQSLRHCSSCSTTVQRWNDTQVVAFNLTNAQLSQKLCTNPVLYGNSLTPKHMKHST